MNGFDPRGGFAPLGPPDHVPEDLLLAFVEGEVNEQVAAHVAEHLDACPACATRATGLEPLSAALAAVTDPVPPPDLVARTLAQFERAAGLERASARPAAEARRRAPMPEVVVGAALIMVAAMLGSALGTPGLLLAYAGANTSAAVALVRGFAVVLGAPLRGGGLPGALAFLDAPEVALAISTGFALAGVLVTVWYAVRTEPASPSVRRSP